MSTAMFLLLYLNIGRILEIQFSRGMKINQMFSPFFKYHQDMKHHKEHRKQC